MRKSAQLYKDIDPKTVNHLVNEMFYDQIINFFTERQFVKLRNVRSDLTRNGEMDTFKRYFEADPVLTVKKKVEILLHMLPTEESAQLRMSFDDPNNLPVSDLDKLNLLLSKI